MAQLVAAQAIEFARTYVQLTEALQREGVPELIAREEARVAATAVLLTETRRAPCAVCGAS